MNTLTPKNPSKSNSSGNSTMSSSNSSMDMPQQRQSSGDQKQHTSRSRSFLHCLGKHLGRHFLHSHHSNSHSHHDTNIYNSQEDIRSSSTDSFSLSFERASRAECRNMGSICGGGSSIDLTSNSDKNNTSRGSSTSACSHYSPALCLDADELDAYERYSANHIYVEAMYRPALRQEDGEDNANDELSSDDDDAENKCRTNASVQTESTERSAAPATSKGLHLSRISISSSVLGRMFHHFSSSTSTRSLSCNSTPLRRVTDVTSTKSKSKSETSKSSAKNSSASSNSTASKKKEKKQQQSILRPPVPYVYMKGMSGLYSRVPRYSVYCPYSMQQVS